ncbi:MAG: PilW family protein [Thermodesulfobacteriota bacterium]
MEIIGAVADRARPREQGFTLTELLVAMVLAGIVTASLYSAHLTQQRAYKTTEDVTGVQQNLRSAMYFVEKDLRMAGYDPREKGLFGFEGINSYSQDHVKFSLDQNENGAKDDSNDYIQYEFNAADNTLRRKVGVDPSSSFQPIASDISGVNFVFFTASGVTTAIPSEIKSVDITIQGSRGEHSRELQARIVCRNMGL